MMTHDLLFCVFVTFSILAVLYNDYIIRSAAGFISETRKSIRARWHIAQSVSRSASLVFLASLVLDALVMSGVVLPAIQPVIMAGYGLSGTVIFLAAFFLTPCYLQLSPPSGKKQLALIITAIITTGLYSVYYVPFMFRLCDQLEQSTLQPFVSPFLTGFSIPLYLTYIFSILASLYILRVLFYLRHAAAGWKRLLLGVVVVLASSVLFFLYYFLFEMLLSFIPDSTLASTFFRDFDRGNIAIRAFFLFLAPSINILLITLLAPVYAYQKYKTGA